MKALLGKWTALLLALLFLLVLLATMPARFLIDIAGLQRAGIYLSSVEGPWHRGSARVAQIQLAPHPLRFSELNWDIKLSRLLLARLALDVQGKFAGQDVQAEVAAGLFGGFRVSELSGRLRFDDIRPLMNQLIIPVDGSLELVDVAFDYDGQWLESLSGNAQLRSLSATVPLTTIQIGDINVKLGLEEQPSSTLAVADIVSYRGDYGVDGSFRLFPSYDYELYLTGEPDGTVDPRIVQSMGMIFGPPADGRYSFEHSGTLGR